MALLWALLGLTVGPFLYLAIYRLPRLEKLSAPVECPRCHTRRPLYTRSALFSSLMGERGNCRGCGAPPDRTGAIVELATGIVFWTLFIRFGPTPELIAYTIYACFLIVVFVIDWQHRLILNRVTYPGIVVAAILTPTLTGVSPAMMLAGLMVAGVLFALLYIVGHLIFHQEALGLGDVKLAMLLGTMAGFPMVVWWLLLGSLFGALSGVVLLVMRRSSLHDFMPYGTAMCLGAFAALFLGPSILF